MPRAASLGRERRIERSVRYSSFIDEQQVRAALQLVVGASVPKVGDPLGIAAFGLAAADADEVEPVRPGLERADDGGSDAEHVPGRELDELMVELGATRAGDDDVGLLLLAMPVPHGIRAPGS